MKSWRAESTLRGDAILSNEVSLEKPGQSDENRPGVFAAWSKLPSTNGVKECERQTRPVWMRCSTRNLEFKSILPNKSA
jgi:hypothetical protein